MIKNKKGILILVVFLLIIYIFISIIISNITKYSNTVFIGDNTKIEVKNDNIRVYNSDVKIEKQDVKILFKNDFIDGYIMSKKVDSTSVENSYIAYNEKGEMLSFDYIFIGHTKDLSLNVKKTKITEINDFRDIYEFLKQNNINISSKDELNYYEKCVIDKYEYIYSIGFIYGSKYKSFVFMKKDDKYTLLSKEENDYTDIDNIRLRFAALIDFNKDDEYEYVIKKSMSDYGPNYYELYNFDGNVFNKIGVEE